MDVIIYTHPDTLESIKPAWQNWQNQPNNDYEQFLLICRIRPEVHYPWVMVAYEDGSPCALLAGRVETTNVAPPLGYLKLVPVFVKNLTLLHHGFLGRQDESVANFFISSLKDWLQRVDVKTVQFPFLAEDSPLKKVLQERVSFWQCEKGMLPKLHWRGILPPLEEPLLMHLKSKSRSTIRRRERAFNAAFSGRLTWQWLTTFTDIPTLCHELENLASKTYQRGLGVGFRNDVEHCLRYQLYADKGLLRVALLKLDDELIGFVIGIRYQDALFIIELGYDRRYKDYSPGINLMLWMMERLREEGVVLMDWGKGGAQYKSQLGNVPCSEQSFWLFKATPPILMLRVAFGGIIRFERVARFLLNKMQLTDRVKSRWRQSIRESL